MHFAALFMKYLDFRSTKAFKKPLVIQDKRSQIVRIIAVKLVFPVVFAIAIYLAFDRGKTSAGYLKK